MDYNEIVVKDSPGLCRCCLSEGCYKDLATEYTWMSETEVYADMLLECFDISISQHPDGPNGPKRLICEVCITRLRDACNFKKQVQDSECKFVDMLARGEFQKVEYNAPMKDEMIVEVSPEELEVEYLEDLDDFDEDDLPLMLASTSQQASSSNVAETPKGKSKRGRPKKSDVEPDKKPKIPRLTEQKPKTPKAVKGVIRPALSSKSPLSSTKRNRLIKENSLCVLESTTVIPFKWHRQKYLCFYCHKPFKDTGILKDHTNNHHEKPNMRAAVSYLRRDEKVKIDVTDAKCRICDEKVQNLDSIIHHLKNNHDKHFVEEFSFGLIPYRLQANFYQCAVCDTSFPYFVKLNQHMNTHYGTYLCQKCGKSFLSEARLVCHSLSHGSKFSCTICNEVFNTLTQKKHHEAKIHKKSKMLQCSYCSSMFENYNQRKKHHHIAHNVDLESYKCPVCNKSFDIMSKMKVHYKEVHVREKNYSCVVCEQKFFSKTHVQKHMVKHFGERIHQCNVCKKSYARKQTLRDHMKIHCDEKKYKCYDCNQAFVHSNTLRLHMKIHSQSDIK